MEPIGKALENYQHDTQAQKKPVSNIKKVWEPESQVIEIAHEQITQDGYSANPFCERCRGKGWVYLKVPITDERFGKAFPCVAKGCFVDSRNKYKQGEGYLSKIGVKNTKHSFVNFQSIKGNRDAYDAFYKLAYGKTELPFLLCYGGVGNGKTHLCEALTIILNWRGVTVKMHTLADLLSELRLAIPDHTIDYKLLHLQDIEALVLDDWGVEYGSDWESSKLEQLIDARYRKRLITILTTNRDIGWLPERILSRFSDPDISQMVLNSAPDYRRR